MIGTSVNVLGIDTSVLLDDPFPLVKIFIDLLSLKYFVLSDGSARGHSLVPLHANISVITSGGVRLQVTRCTRAANSHDLNSIRSVRRSDFINRRNGHHISLTSNNILRKSVLKSV